VAHSGEAWYKGRVKIAWSRDGKALAMRCMGGNGIKVPGGFAGIRTSRR
jgi:hypothetical protein